MFGSWAHRLRDLCSQAATSTVSRGGMRVTAAQLLDGLPALGDVLYVPMRPVHAHRALTSELSRGVLVETLALAPLLQTCMLAAISAITVEGPREWIECMDREGRICVRLHLLPDTDYLAWDRLLACAEPQPTRGLRASRPASAQVLRFHARRLAGLSVFGAEFTGRVSPLSRQLAGQIARAEAVTLQPVGCS